MLFLEDVPSERFHPSSDPAVLTLESDTPLRRLASRAGILGEYLDQTGSQVCRTSDRTRAEILLRMGFDVSTPDRTLRCLQDLEHADRARLAEPVRVAEDGTSDAQTVSICFPEAQGSPLVWSIHLLTEAGDDIQVAASSIPDRDGMVVISLPEILPLGYHTLHVHAKAGGHEKACRQSLIVVPQRCPSVREVSGRDRIFGITANLYSVRSKVNWGVGDIGDLGRLLQWTARIGGTFVGINPLHALRNRGSAVSPYSPVSRIHRNPIYLDITAIPEWDHSDEARRIVGEASFVAELYTLRTGSPVEYERVMVLKRRVLEALHRDFTMRAGPTADLRDAAFRRFVEEQGESLERFATFEAIADDLGSGSWHRWPGAFQNPESAEVTRFRGEHEREIDFHRWLQFELDRQLAVASELGRRAGLPIGVYQDLAIGSAPDGADVWGYRHLFLVGVSVGAPPDDYSATGQNWGLPPLDPRALYEDAYRYWITLVRASMRHSGALRIDHAMGLFRQFWIPDGMSGQEGAYVRFPAQDLLGILALEAHRHRAIVVGEDLGTVPPEIPPSLHRRGILSSRIFYFERDDTSFHSASEYEPMALTTANTHDMPTLAGFWGGRDIEIKRSVGIIEDDEEYRQQKSARVDDRRAILERLAAEELLHTSGELPSEAELRGAIHAFLCRTPSAMVGLSLDDLIGETEPVNVPGVPPDRFASWTRRLSTLLEDLDEDPCVQAALRCPER